MSETLSSSPGDMDASIKLNDSTTNMFLPRMTNQNLSFTSTKTKKSVISEEAEVPALSGSERLDFFFGNEELLSYYLGLRQASSEVRRTGGQCFCDPRDKKMCRRLEHEGFTPRVSLKDVEDDESSELGFTSKQIALDGDTNAREGDAFGENEIQEPVKEVDGEAAKRSFVCGVQGCNAEFTSLSSHESHYHRSHNFVCHVCRRTFVSNFLLEVHLEENHDSYFQVLSPRIDMYRCLVESCSLKFRTPEIRKDHLVKTHMFPANFSFHRPIKDRSEKDKPSKAKSQSANTSGNSNDSDMDSLDLTSQPPEACMDVDQKFPLGQREGEGTTETAVSAKGKSHQRGRGQGSASQGRRRGGKVPPTVCFGRGSQRAFQHRGRGRGRHWHQMQAMDVDTTVDINKMEFGDMVESLVDCG